MFVINTAAEIGGAKHNYELAFPTHPSIEELKAEGAAVFSRVADKPITVGAMQIYDSRGQEWVDLLYESQILNHCQVFVYQDVAPGVAVEAAVPFEEKTGAVFQELSRTHRDLLTVEDFVKGLQALRLDLSDASLSNLFHRSDCDNDGYLSVTEFLSFSTKHPTLLEAAYQRCIDMYKEQQTDREVQLTHHKLQTLAEKGREKREALRAAETFEVKNRTTLHSQIGALAIAQERDREASDRLVKTTESVDMATHALEVKKQDLQTARDEERKTCCRAEEADLELASAVALMEQSEQATTRASGNVKALETELMLQKEELQKCMDEQQRCSGMHAAAETRKRLAKEALARASEFSSAMASEVITAENDLKMLGRREQDATAFARASSIEAARELATHEMIKSSMAEVRQQRELLAVEEVEARREQAELLSIKREHEAQSKRRVDRRAYDDLKEMHLIEKELAKDYYPSSPSPVPHTPATKHHSPTRSPATSPGLVLTEAERAAVFRARTIAAAAAASTTPQPQVQPQLQHSYTRLASPVVQTTPSLMLSPRYRPVPIWTPCMMQRGVRRWYSGLPRTLWKNRKEEWIHVLHTKVVFETLLVDVEKKLPPGGVETPDTEVSLKLTELFGLDENCVHWLTDRVVKRYEKAQSPIGPQVACVLVQRALKRRPLLGVSILTSCQEPQSIPTRIYESTLQALASSSSITDEQRLQASLTVSSLQGPPTSKSLNIMLEISLYNKDVEYCTTLLTKMENLGIPLMKSVGEKVLPFLCQNNHRQKAAEVLASLAACGGLTPPLRALARQFDLEEMTNPMLLRVPARMHPENITFAMSPLNPTRMSDERLSVHLRRYHIRVKHLMAKNKVHRAWEEFKEAKKLFETAKATGQEVEKKSYTEMLCTVRAIGSYVDAVSYYEESKERGVWCPYIVCITIAAMVLSKNVTIARSVLKEYREKPLGHDNVPYDAMLRVCQEATDVAVCKEVWDWAAEDNITIGRAGHIATMYIYVKLQDLTAAMQLYNDSYPQHYLSPGFLLPLIGLLSGLEHWGLLRRVLHKVRIALQNRVYVSPRVMGMLINYAAARGNYPLAKDTYLLSLMYKIPTEEKTLVQLLDLALLKEDVLMCCKLYESLLNRTLESARFVLVTAMRKADMCVGLFKNSLSTVRRMAGKSDARTRETLMNMLHTAMKALARTPYVREDSMYYYTLCLHYSRFMRRKDGSYHKTRYLMGTVLFLYRHNPDILTAKVWTAIAVAWNFQHLFHAFEEKEVEILPPDIIDSVLTHLCNEGSSWLPEQVEAAVGNCVHAMSRMKIRHVTGCYSSFYQRGLQAILDNEHRSRAGQEVAKKATSEEACKELKNLLSMGNTPQSDPEPTEAAKPKTGLLVVPFQNLGLTRLLLELVIDELRANEGVFASGRNPTPALFNEVRRVPQFFPDLQSWTDTFEELCGRYAPQRAKLEEEVDRLKRLLKLKESEDK